MRNENRAFSKGKVQRMYAGAHVAGACVGLRTWKNGAVGVSKFLFVI